MSTATLVVALAAPPADTTAADRQVLEVFAQINGKDKVPVLLRCGINSSAAEGLKTKQAGNHLIVSGDLSLEDEQPVIYVRTLCDSPTDCYVNEVTIVGRLVGEARVAESNKSSSRSAAVNRTVNKQEVTDWFKVRGYGYVMDKLINAPKGTLVEVTGSLDQRTNRDGQPYIELKSRSIRVHGKGKGGSDSPSNMAAGTKAYGYEHKDFSASVDHMPDQWPS